MRAHVTFRDEGDGNAIGDKSPKNTSKTNKQKSQKKGAKASSAPAKK